MVRAAKWMWRGSRATLGLVGCAWLAGCAPRPLVMPLPPPREPITGLDVVDPGVTEVSGTLTHLPLAIGMRAPIDPVALSLGYSGGLTHGVGPFEIRVLAGRHLLGQQASLGAGYRLPSAGRWDFVADAALASWKHSGTFTVPPEEEWEDPNRSYEVRGPGKFAYAYRMLTPSVRGRAIWAPKPQLRVPMALRYSYSTPVQTQGLYRFEERERGHLELSVGLIWKPERSCVSLGGGLSITHGLPVVQASAGCSIDWRALAEKAR